MYCNYTRIYVLFTWEECDMVVLRWQVNDSPMEHDILTWSCQPVVGKWFTILHAEGYVRLHLRCSPHTSQKISGLPVVIQFWRAPWGVWSLIPPWTSAPARRPNSYCSSGRCKLTTGEASNSWIRLLVKLSLIFWRGAMSESRSLTLWKQNFWTAKQDLYPNMYATDEITFQQAHALFS